jgi:hypothetical protein
MSTCRLHPSGPRPDPDVLEQCRDLPTSTRAWGLDSRTGTLVADGVAR